MASLQSLAAAMPPAATCTDLGAAAGVQEVTECFQDKSLELCPCTGRERSGVQAGWHRRQEGFGDLPEYSS